MDNRSSVTSGIAKKKSKGNRGYNRRSRTASKSRPLGDLPPPPPIVSRRGDGKLVKTKDVYSSGPKRAKLTELNSAWCGLPVFQSTIPCSILDNLISDYAVAYVLAVNERSGRVPTAGGTFSHGLVRLYLYGAVYCHTLRLGVLDDDSTIWMKFGKYRIPTSFAVALQQLGTYKDPDTGASYTPHFPALTLEAWEGYSFTEGATQVPVVVGRDATFGDEPYFGLGASVTQADLTDTVCDVISSALSSAMKTVQTQYVAKFASEPSGFLQSHGSGVYTSVKKLSNVAPLLSIARSNVVSGTCIIRDPLPATASGIVVNNNITFVSLAVHLSLDLEYAYGHHLHTCFSKFGVDPYNVSLYFPQMSWSVLAGVVLDWLINIGQFSGNNAGGNNNLVAWMNIVYAYLLAKTPFVGRIFSSSGTSPFYVSPNHLRIGVPSLFGEVGMQLTRVCDTIICPAWPSWTTARSAMNTFVSGNVYVPTFDDVPGSFPLQGTVVAGVTLGSFAPPSDALLYNACYLALREEIATTQSTILNAQTVEYDMNKPYCPCAVSYFAGENRDGNSSYVLLPMTSIMSCPRPVGAVSCKAQMSVCLDTQPRVSPYYKTISDVMQNRYRIATEASKVGNNVTQLVATNSGAPWKQSLAAYTGNLAARIEWDQAIVRGSDLIAAANEYIKNGGMVGTLPDPSFWNSLMSKDHNLEELVGKVASGISYVTPAVRVAIAAYNAIRVHYPLV